MYMSICVFVRMCLYVYVYMYMSIGEFVRMCLYVYVYLCVCTYVSMSLTYLARSLSCNIADLAYHRAYPSHRVIYTSRTVR